MIDGLEIHPSIVHFPIALTIVGALAVLAYALLRRDFPLIQGVVVGTVCAGAVGTVKPLGVTVVGCGVTDLRSKPGTVRFIGTTPPAP